jgi:hypothetical protein
MTKAYEGPPRWGGAGGPEVICLSADASDIAQNLAICNRRPVLLRLVPRPRRLDVRIIAADGRAPYGRAGPFRLTHDELDELVAVATRLEARRA